jgi:hypothetical protein
MSVAVPHAYLLGLMRRLDAVIHSHSNAISSPGPAVQQALFAWHARRTELNFCHDTGRGQVFSIRFA